MSETATGGAPRSLVKKLAEVMAAIERIPKRGHNDFHHYDYATEADIVSSIRQELAKRHIMLLPSVVKAEREKVGEKGSVLTHLWMEFTFIDGESGETLSQPWLGAGCDKEDKGAYKAMTGGDKYFLLKTFLIPTGDDPEADVTKKLRKPEKVFTADPNDVRPISQPQITRLKALLKTHNTNIDEFKAWVDARFHYKKSEEIQRKDYDAIVTYVIEGVDTPDELVEA